MGSSSVAVTVWRILAAWKRHSPPTASPSPRTWRARPAPAPRRRLVVVHGFPTGPRGAAASAATFPELADRIARECGWHALAFNCRGTGASGGDFSVAGWLADIRAAVSFLDERPDTRGVWVVGIAEGGTLAVVADRGRRSDPRLRGPGRSDHASRSWGRDPGRLLEFARRVGHDPHAGLPGLRAGLEPGRRRASTRSSRHAHRAPRPLFVCIGTADTVVSFDDARALAEAAGEGGELRMVGGAGHELRHDPRAMASLMGWLDRQVS